MTPSGVPIGAPPERLGEHSRVLIDLLRCSIQQQLDRVQERLELIVDDVHDDGVVGVEVVVGEVSRIREMAPPGTSGAAFSSLGLRP